MSDFSQLIRWNANLVRGLAQSVLERAKVIRSSLGPSSSISTADKILRPSTTKRPKKKVAKKVINGRSRPLRTLKSTKSKRANAKG